MFCPSPASITMAIDICLSARNSAQKQDWSTAGGHYPRANLKAKNRHGEHERTWWIGLHASKRNKASTKSKSKQPNKKELIQILLFPCFVLLKSAHVVGFSANSQNICWLLIMLQLSSQMFWNTLYAFNFCFSPIYVLPKIACGGVEKNLMKRRV